MSESYSFNENEKAGVYRAIAERRDMRHFRGDPIDEALLQRLLAVAHQAPSVGFMQPWRIIRIRSDESRTALHNLVEEERQRTAKALKSRSDDFMQLKVQGILDCGEVWVVSLMEQRERHIFGRRTLPQMDIASAACAIQNVWLAARAEGIGVGWVSIFDPQQLRDLLGIPADAEPIAILCLGQVDAFYDEPMLAQEGWAQRGNLHDYVMSERWQTDLAERAQQQWEERS